MYPLVLTTAGKLDKPLLITFITISARVDNCVFPPASAVSALSIT